MTTSLSRSASPFSNTTFKLSRIMKNKKPSSPMAVAGAETPWAWLGVALAGVIALFWAYGPAMHGPFVFDDTKQQYALPAAADPLASWIGPIRPILMFSYWMNVQLSRDDTFSFHMVNVLVHILTT